MPVATLDNPVYVNSPKTRPQRAKAATQALAIQELLFKAAHADKIAAPVLAQVARAWCEVVDTHRVIRMKPAPKPIDVTVKPRKQSTSSGFSESPAQAKPKRAAKVQVQVETPPTDTAPTQTP